MSNKLKAKINKKVLKWAREECNMTEEYASEKLKISVSTLEEWETGRDQPTIDELRKLSKLYRQLLAVFYMTKVPISTKQKFTDYRTIFTKNEEYKNSMSPELTFQVREAIYNRANMIELKEQLGEKIKDFDIKINITDNSDIICKNIIETMNIELKEVYKKNINEKFNYYRSIIENKGILVYQATEVDIKEMRGMALYFNTMPIIILNRKDSYTARIFSLFHELIHLTLRTSSICDMKEANNDQVEIFCNSMAGKILVPTNEILQRKYFDETVIKFLATKSGVSKDVIIKRLLDLKIISFEEYINKLQQYQKDFEELQKKKIKKDGFVPPADDRVSVVGKTYTSTVLRAYNENKITFNEISEYLNIKLKHYDKLFSKVIT